MLGKWRRTFELVAGFYKVAREVVGGGIGPIVIIVEAIQCKVD
jgi:hypothetical protein